MTAHEEHAQFVVLKRESELAGFHLRFAMLEFRDDLRSFFLQQRIVANDIERAVAGNLIEPSARVVGDAGMRPELQSLEQRVLYDFFRQFEMRRTQQPGEPGDHLSGTLAEQMVDHGLDLGSGASSTFAHALELAAFTMASVSRTSMVPPYSRCGQSRV